MYETTVNQLVTVAVFLVLQSIQLAGYLFGVHSALNSDFPLFVLCSFPRIRNQARAFPFRFRVVFGRF